MNKNTWVVDGRKADGAVLCAVLAQAFSDKCARLDAMRVKVAEELGEVDARILNKETKKRLREQEREARELERELRRVGSAIKRQLQEADKAIVLYAKPFGGGHPSEREIARMDLLFHPTQSLRRHCDGLSSFHCKFTSRGLGSRRSEKSRMYKPGEAVRHLRYIIRESAREIVRGGLVSNISPEPDELAGFFAALEELETHDRSNANVYMSLVLSLPHELSPKARLEVLGEVTSLLAAEGLPYVGVLHAPDPRGDQRNYHAHIMFSLRPCVVEAAGRYLFSVDKLSDLNDETFIYPFRQQVALIFNEAMKREDLSRRFTHLSNKERGLAEGSGKSTPGQKHWQRKEAELQAMQSEHKLRTARSNVIVALQTTLLEVAGARTPDLSVVLQRLRAGALQLVATHLKNIAIDAQQRSRRLSDVRASAGAMVTKRVTSRGESSTRAAESTQAAPVTKVARTQPVDRGSERRRSIAAAARRLRIGSVPVTKTSKGFNVATYSPGLFDQIERFEAEDVIQRLHQRNWQDLLTKVRAEVEGATRMPATLRSDRPRLERDFMPLEYRAAYAAAAKSDDMQRLLRELRDEWIKREQRAKAKLRLEEAEAREKKGKHAAAVVARLEGLILAGRWSRDALNKAKPDIDVVCDQLVAGGLVMRKVGNELTFYVAQSLTRGAIIRLKQSQMGTGILKALGKVTLDEPLGASLSELPSVSVPLPQPVPTPINEWEEPPAVWHRGGGMEM